MTNKILLEILKKRLENKKGTWAEELLGVLWAYRTTTKTPTRKTLFTLTYGSEAIVPIEIRMLSYKVQHYDKESNNKGLKEHLDLLEESGEEAEMQIMTDQRKLEHYFNRRVKPRLFKVWGLVLKEDGMTTQGEGILDPRWEGHLVIASHQLRSYCLKDQEGKELPHPENSEHLMKYFA